MGLSISPKNIIISLIVFTMAITGVIQLIDVFKPAALSDTDQVLYDGFVERFNQQDEINDTVSALEASTQQDPDFGVFGVLNALIQAGWFALRSLFTSLGFLGAITGGLSSVFGLPDWVSWGILSITTVMIVFAIFSAIFQKEF